MIMDKLTPEIIDLILDQLKDQPWDRPKYASYATISRKWQAVVETRTYREKEFANTDLEKLSAAFTGARQAALRQLYVRINLPAYASTPEDRARNQQVFRHSVKSMLDLLAGWKANEAGLSLALWPGSVREEAASLVTESVDVEDADSGASRRFLRFSDADVQGFPAVSCVKEFSISTLQACAFYPRSLCQLAGVFNTLEVLDLEYWDPAVKFHALRKEHRNDFAHGLRSLQGKLPALRRLGIKRNGAPPPHNHSFECQSFEEDGVDPLCEAVRLLAQPTVRELNLTAVEISPVLFGSGEWKNLRQLTLHVSPILASGKWLLTGDKPAAAPAPEETPSPEPEWEDSDPDEDEEAAPALGEDDDGDRTKDQVANGEKPRNYWRTMPDENTMVPLVRDMTTAICGGGDHPRAMPALQAVTLMVRHGDGFVWIKCAEAGSPFPGESGAGKARRWTVQCREDSSWDVPGDLADAWRSWAGESGEVELPGSS